MTVHHFLRFFELPGAKKTSKKPFRLVNYEVLVGEHVKSFGLAAFLDDKPRPNRDFWRSQGAKPRNLRVDMGPGTPKMTPKWAPRASRRALGASWAPRGGLGAPTQSFWSTDPNFLELLGPSWRLLGRSWRRLGPSWGRLGASWAALGTSRAAPGAHFSLPGGTCWSFWGLFLSALGKSRKT